MASLPDDLVPYAAVLCRGDSVPGQPRCGQVKINEAEYSRQMDRPDSFWMCPNCGSTADFDDGFFENLHEVNEEDESPPLEIYLEDAVRIFGTQAIREACDKFDAGGYPWLTNTRPMKSRTRVHMHFGISATESQELFSGDGCNGARTAEQAAAYIERFAERKWPAPKSLGFATFRAQALLTALSQTHD